MKQHQSNPQVYQDRTGQTPSWRLMTRFVLRSPGFPFSWLSALRFVQSTAVAKRLLATQETLKQHQQVFEELFSRICEEETAAGSDKGTFRLWYRLARTIRRGQKLDSVAMAAICERGHRPDLFAWLEQWQNICQELVRLHQESEDVFKIELREMRQALRQAVIDPRFQEALWLSNPAMYEVGWQYYGRHWDGQQRPFKIKHLERRFYTYLQRFCAKNDTASFFGPLNYGDFYGDKGLSYKYSAGRVRQRRVFFAYWSAVALAQRIASEPALQPYLCPRHNPLKDQALPPHQAAIYHLSDGSRSLMLLADCLQLPLEELTATVEHMVQIGLLHLDLPIPPAILDPLGYLILQLSQWPAHIREQQRWLGVLRQFQQACEDFMRADLSQRQRILGEMETRYSGLTGAESRRGQGQMFQDRTLLYEECLGNIEALHLSAEHRAQIAEKMAPIASLCATYSQLLRNDLQVQASALFDDLSKDGQPVSFVRFIAAWRRRYPATAHSSSVEQFQQQVIDLVARQTDEHVCRLSVADLVPLCDSHHSAVVLSPDLLLAAPNLEAIAQGDYQVILGEIHHGVQPAGWMLTFADDLADWQREINKSLPMATETTVPANLLFGRRMKTAPPEFAEISVQASAVSVHPQQLELSQLLIERRGEKLCLRTPTNPRVLCFYPLSYGIPEALYAPFACFSYLQVVPVPIRLGEHTPRIEINGVVYQRERWQCPASQFPMRHMQGSSFQLLHDFIAFQQRMGLPDHVFVSAPTEPKPVYIDFQNYFALELLVHLASQNETLTFVEMLPDPEQLWLYDTDGRYCCELRTVLSSAN